MKSTYNMAVVSESGQLFECVFRGILRKTKEKVLVGDLVDFDATEKVINKILPRKNQLRRPPIANVDQILIFVAPVPAPDLILVDQLIISADMCGIDSFLVVNKEDLGISSFGKDIVSQYSGVTKGILQVSSLTGKGVDEIRKVLRKKLSVLAGQSGVGKSTLINSLIPDANLKTGDLSEKILRGVNTTRHSEIYSLPGKNSGEIIDTPGFSLFELGNIKSSELGEFFGDVKDFAVDCKFANCGHSGTTEENCGVLKAVKTGKLNAERYARFLQLKDMLERKEKDLKKVNFISEKKKRIKNEL